MNSTRNENKRKIFQESSWNTYYVYLVNSRLIYKFYRVKIFFTFKKFLIDIFSLTYTYKLSNYECIFQMFKSGVKCDKSFLLAFS